MSPAPGQGHTAASAPGDLTQFGDRDGPEDGELGLGESVGRYRIVAHIGAGAMGIVYAAHDEKLNRRVALKIVRPDRRRGQQTSSTARLIREAQALAHLAHPNVVPVYDVGSHDERVYLTMELVDGRNLREWAAVKKRSWQEAVDVMIDAGRGLAAAHAAGLVHRDFKPDNVLVDAQGHARVGDFGLARAHGSGGDLDVDVLDAPSESLSSQLTQTGMVMGTPLYMSPEQHSGHTAEPASDQFAFCVALHELVFGVRPFFGRDIGELARAKSRGQLHAPTHIDARAARVPAALRAVITRGLASSPTERWSSMAELIDELVRIRGRRRPATMLVAGAVMLSIVGTWAWIALAPERCRDDDLCFEWNENGRDKLAAAFAISPSPSAEDVWPGLRDELDGHVEALHAAGLALCAATHGVSDAEVDARRACLHERSVDLRATVTTLSDADVSTVANAADLLERLRPADDCSSTLSHADRTPPPHDPGLRDALRVIDTRLEAGQYRLARTEAHAALAQASEQNDRAAEAEAAYLLGTAELHLGDVAAAERELDRAYHAAQELGLDRLALAVATRMVFFHATRTHRVGEGEVWARHSHALLDRLGGDDPIGSRLIENEAHLLRASGDAAGAEEKFRIARELRLAHNGADSRSASMIRNSLGNLLAARGDYVAALEQHRLAYESRISRLGPHHPDVAMSLINLARVYEAMGRYSDALGELDRAEPVVAETHGEQSTMMATLLLLKASSVISSGDPQLALVLLGRSADILAARLGPGHLDLVQIDNARGVAYIRIGDDARAAHELVDALHRLDETDQRTAVLRAHVEGNLARVRFRLGDFDEAERLARSSFATLAREQGEERASVAKAIAVLARTLLTRGRVDEVDALLALEVPATSDASLLAIHQADRDFFAAWADHLRGGPLAPAIAAAERARELRLTGFVALGDTLEYDNWLTQYEPAGGLR